jgi:pyridinium-3,5-biscarboxylic acid mononucleotide sulfurtransferase
VSELAVEEAVRMQGTTDAPPVMTEVTPETEAKEQALGALFRAMGSVLVAYSGGVDSSYVAFIASAELGARALCVTGDSPSLAAHQRTQAVETAARFNFRQEIIQTAEMQDARYTANAGDRCYFCKTELYDKLKPRAEACGFQFVVDGSTTDDLGDYRPGRRAAAEHGVRSPLIEVGLSKREVRALSRRAGLPTWNAPASPCLSSRIAYGTPVTIARLRTVETGEEIMRALGFREFRVRHHDELVRLEIAPQELERALDRQVVDELARRFRALGFRYVTLDLHGYRTGAMNEILNKTQPSKPNAQPAKPVTAER